MNTMTDDLRTALGLLASAESDDDVLVAYGLVVAAKYSAEDRRKMAENGQAMGDGGYPIADSEDLDAAIRAVGRGSGSHDAIRAHIIKRAKALGQAGKIPDNWNSDGTMKAAATLAAMDHAYVDANGTGMCDVCGMPESAHAMGEAAAEALAAAPPEEDIIEGIPFEIPFMCAVNRPTGDGRTFEHFDLAPLPWPFATQFQRTPGHDGADISGKITEATLNDQGIVSGKGVYLLTDDGIEAAKLAANEAMPGVSIDADEAYEMSLAEDGTRVYHRARIRGAIQLQMPAFAEAKVVVNPADIDAALARLAAASADVTAQAQAMLASVSAPARWAPPAEWFDQPQLDRLTPLTITEDGRVYGHLAGWGQCHTDHAPNLCLNPPSSASGYAFFNTGEIECADGTRRPVGTLTFGAGHASAALSAIQAAEHYGNTAKAGAYVRAGEDGWGIWLAGMILPELSDADRRAVMASSPSGDWRWVGGNYELVAALCVNAPAYPIGRTEKARVLVASGSCRSLILAPLPRSESEVDEMRARIAALESGQAALAASVQPFLQERADAILAAMGD